jgi:hypothetical protein
MWPTVPAPDDDDDDDEMMMAVEQWMERLVG